MKWQKTPIETSFMRGQLVRHRLSGEMLLWIGQYEMKESGYGIYGSLCRTGRMSCLRLDYSVLCCFPEEIEAETKEGKL